MLYWSEVCVKGLDFGFSNMLIFVIVLVGFFFFYCVGISNFFFLGNFFVDSSVILIKLCRNN